MSNKREIYSALRVLSRMMAKHCYEGTGDVEAIKTHMKVIFAQSLLEEFETGFIGRAQFHFEVENILRCFDSIFSDQDYDYPQMSNLADCFQDFFYQNVVALR